MKQKLCIICLCLLLLPVTVILCTFGWELRCKTRTYKDFERQLPTVQDAVFRIAAETENGSVHGYTAGASGAVFERHGDCYYALTALHVVDRADALHYYAVPADAPVYEKPEDMSFSAYDAQYYGALPVLRVEFADPQTDLAIVSFRYAGDLPAAGIKRDDVLNSTAIAVVGCDGTPHTPPAVTCGTVNGKRYWEFHVDDGRQDVRVFSHSAYVTYGSSGAAAFDSEMQLAGINIGGVTGLFGTFRSGVIVPAWSLRDIVRDWKNAGGAPDMAITSNEELMETVGENFLWDVVSAYVEADPEGIRASLRPIGYLAPADIEKLSEAEVHQSDEFITAGYEENAGTLTVSFEMPAIIMAQSADNAVSLRITTYCTGTAEIPNAAAFDWNKVLGADLPLQEKLSYSHLVKNLRVCYEDTEADDLTALHWD